MQKLLCSIIPRNVKKILKEVNMKKVLLFFFLGATTSPMTGKSTILKRPLRPLLRPAIGPHLPTRQEKISNRVLGMSKETSQRKQRTRFIHVQDKCICLDSCSCKNSPPFLTFQKILSKIPIPLI